MATDETTSNTQPTETSSSENNSISSVLSEKRKFPPPAEFAKNAHITSMEEYEKIYAAAALDPEAYWGGIAEQFHWLKSLILCWNGTALMQSGLTAEKQISATMLLIFMSTAGEKTRLPSSGKVKRETSGF